MKFHLKFNQKRNEVLLKLLNIPTTTLSQWSLGFMSWVWRISQFPGDATAGGCVAPWDGTKKHIFSRGVLIFFDFLLHNLGIFNFVFKASAQPTLLHAVFATPLPKPPSVFFGLIFFLRFFFIFSFYSRLPENRVEMRSFSRKIWKGSFSLIFSSFSVIFSFDFFVCQPWSHQSLPAGLDTSKQQGFLTGATCRLPMVSPVKNQKVQDHGNACTLRFQLRFLNQDVSVFTFSLLNTSVLLKPRVYRNTGKKPRPSPSLNTPTLNQSGSGRRKAARPLEQVRRPARCQKNPARHRPRGLPAHGPEIFFASSAQLGAPANL